MEIIETTLNNGVVQLIAPQGFWLTKKNAPKAEKTFTRSSFIAVDESVDNWMLATDAERESWSAEPTEIEVARAAKISEINNFDSSPVVNEFIINCVGMWMDKNTRSSLLQSTQMEKIAGKESTTIWTETTPPAALTVPIDEALKLLMAIELYAKECYSVTQQHKAKVYSLTTIEAVNNYDFTTGYPPKINIQL